LEALRDFNRAIENDPDKAPAWLERGLLHLRLRQTQKALTDLEKAQKLGADPATVHYHLARVHLERRDAEAARESLQQALRHNPTHEEAVQLQKTLQSQ
jgi:tetratricopeptide (TPR) repeat protein